MTKYKITYCEVPHGGGIFAMPEPIGSEIVESETADKLQSYIESKKDAYGSPYKKEELFGYQYTSSQGGVKVTEYIEPKIKTL